MNESQAILQLIADKRQRSPFRQTEYIGQQKRERDPVADKAAWDAYYARLIAMAAGK